VESTSVGPPPIALRGAVDATHLGRSDARSLLLTFEWGGILQTLSFAPLRRLGCSRSATRRGPRFVRGLCSRALGRASRPSRRDAPLSRHRDPPVMMARVRGTAVSLPTEVRQLVRGCARASDTLQKPAGVAWPREASIGPFLTERRRSQTGSRAHGKPHGAKSKVRGSVRSKKRRAPSR